MKLRIFALCLTIAAWIAPQSAGAFSSGVSAGALGASGCNAVGVCHGTSPGTAPTVSLTGPTTVEAGSVNIYSFIINSPSGQPDGGFTAWSTVGEFGVGGPDSSVTTLLPSGSGNFNATHSAAKSGVGGEVRFSFEWEAPLAAGPATIEAWGNAVNGSGVNGDAATYTSLAITVEDPPAPAVPGTSPWAEAGLMTLLVAAGALFLRRRLAPLS